MRINFDIAREQSNELYKEITNDNINGDTPFNFHSQIELYFVKEGQVDACIIRCVCDDKSIYRQSKLRRLKLLPCSKLSHRNQTWHLTPDLLSFSEQLYR